MPFSSRAYSYYTQVNEIDAAAGGTLLGEDECMSGSQHHVVFTLHVLKLFACGDLPLGNVQKACSRLSTFPSKMLQACAMFSMCQNG